MQPENNSPWQYKPDSGEGSEPGDPASPQDDVVSRSKPASDEVVSWTASEYIDHPHGAGWYGALMLGTVGLAGVIYFITKEYFATGVIVVLGVIVAVFAARKPRIVTYELGARSLKIGEKSYPYSQYKSFSIIREGSLSSVSLMPLKRMMSPISAYFAAEDEEHIVNVLGRHLPYEERKLDRIDRLTTRLRF